MPKRQPADATAIRSRSDETQKKLEKEVATKHRTPPPTPPEPPPARNQSTRRACEDQVADSRHRADVDANEEQLADCEPADEK